MSFTTSINMARIFYLLICFCCFFGNVAFAATNPTGKTIRKTSEIFGMEATLNDPTLTNNGNITMSGIGAFDNASGLWANTSMPHQTTNTNFVFLNTGTITLTNRTNTLSQAGLSGMDATGGSNNSAGHRLTNTGTISIDNRVTSQKASAWGMNAYSDFQKGHELINSGKMSFYVSGEYTSAFGMTAGGQDDTNYTSGGHLVHNQAKGVINIEAHTTADSTQQVYGLRTTGTGVHTLINDGKLTLTGISKGTSEVYGMVALASTGIGSNAVGTVNFSNGVDAILNVTAQGTNVINYAYGAYTDLAGSHSFTNKGSITATSKSSVGTSVYAYGFSAINQGDMTMSNSGTMIMSAENNSDSTVIAAGFSTHTAGGRGHILSNAGTMTVNATGGGPAGDAYAYGMNVPFGTVANASNSGTISATATGENDVQAKGIMGSTLTNSGTITAKSNSSNGAAIAYGMHVVTAGRVDNLGTINVAAQGASSAAYEVFGDRNYSVGTWALSLRDFTNYKVFGGAGGITVNFDNSTLILRPGDAAHGFAYDTEYNVQDMVNADPTITGSIKDVGTEMELVKATLTGTSIANQKVSLTQNVTEDTNPGHGIASKFVQVAEARMGNVSTQLGASLRQALLAPDLSGLNSGIPAGSPMQDDLSPTKDTKWSVFLAPHGSFTSNSDADIHGGTGGFFGGLTHRFSDDFSLGVHMDLSSSSFSGEYMDMKASSFAFSGGVHASYTMTPEWYVRGSITASIDDNDISLSEGATGNLTASTSYMSNAFFGDVATGYIFKFDDKHSITPEIGLSWLNICTQGYDLDWQGTAYDMHVEANNYNAFYGTAMLSYSGVFDLDEQGSVVINAGLGLRQNLSGFEIESKLRFGGDVFTTRSTEDPTSVLAVAGVKWKKDNFSVALNYNGTYGQMQNSHGGMLEVKFDF